MKYFMMSIFAKGSGSGFKYIYPERFDTFVDFVMVGPIYENIHRVGECRMVFGTFPKYAGRFMNCNELIESKYTFKVREIDEQTFIGFWKYQESKTRLPDENIVTGEPNSLITILAKAVLGKELTESEKNSLDPEKEDLGIGKPFTVEQRLKNILSRFEE